MIRLIAGAVAAAVAAGVILYQMRGTAELALWEILLLVLVVVQYRGIPDRGDPLETPLFRLPTYESVRLPQDVAAVELAVVDAVSGYLMPDRRLRPLLQRISRHRLSGHGIEMESDAGKERLGVDGWDLLTREGDESIDADELMSLVETLEEL